MYGIIRSPAIYAILIVGILFLCFLVDIYNSIYMQITHLKVDYDSLII